MIAARFGVNQVTVYRWVARGWLNAEAGGGKGRRYRFRLDEETELRLRATAQKAHGYKPRTR